MRLVSLFALIAQLATALPAMGQDRALLESAMSRAVDSFERALPTLGASYAGVNTAQYRDAISLQQFSSSVWGSTVMVKTEIRAEATGSCSRFAAFVRIPPENGAVRLVLCPQFFTPDADALRELTVLHEMVHVVAGSDECQAMAFAAAVQQAAAGRFTSVDAYWRANGCEGSAYRLPD